MKRRRLSWFAFDVSDFLHNDARLMSLAEAGAYVKLLCHAYLDSRCSLPKDENILARILGVSPKEWKQVRAGVLDKFELGKDGRLYNQDLLEERAIAESKSVKARERAENKWEKARDRVEVEPPSPLHLPSQGEKPEARRDETTRGETTTTTTRGDASANAPAKADANASANAPANARGSSCSDPPNLLLSNSLPLWVRKIWQLSNETILCVLGSKESDGIKQLISECGESAAKIAWYYYVTEDPPKYHLEPVQHVDSGQSKTGHKWATNVEDQGAITQFPVLAFLATCQGYVDEARELLARLHDGKANNRDNYVVEGIRTAMEKGQNHD